MTEEPTIWPLAPHTEVKHKILREYLNAWYPKLQWTRRVVFIDGFAGPGVYSKGEPGSPVIAVDAVLNHKGAVGDCEFLYIFVEQNQDRFDHLTEIVGKIQTPNNVKVRTIHGDFADELSKILDDIEARDQQLAPALVLIDPFGFSGMPMDLIARVASHPRSEFLVSFMYESINRWLSHPNLEGTFDSLFGCADWREAVEMQPPDVRRDFLINLYASRLQAIGLEYVRHFQMLDEGNRTEYFLVFASHSKEGLKAIKAAMWKADPSGRFRFSDASASAQLPLIQPEPDYAELKRLMMARFSGQHATIEEIEDYVVLETVFRETHFKTKILAPMERVSELEVIKSSRKQKRGYPPGTTIRFA